MTTEIDEAERIVNKFYNMPICESVEAAKYAAYFTIDEIMKALKTTIGHCELRIIDRDECIKDLDFWQGVKDKIEQF